MSGMTETKQVINRLYAPTWRWLKLNEEQVSLPESLAPAKVLPEGQITAGASASVLYGPDCGSGLGADFAAYLGSNLPSGAGYILEPEPLIRLSLVSRAGQAQAASFALSVPDGKECTLCMDYASEEKGEGTLLVDLQIRLGQGASLHLIQNDRLNPDSCLYNGVRVICGKEAKMDSVQMWVGGKTVYAGYRAELEGDASVCTPSVGYWTRTGHKSDFNYEMVHRGKETSCDVLFSGILDEGAAKTFRGVIDFKTGSSGSVGTENENVLLTGDRVLNRTIPLILCSEEDVKGNHGATIGKLSGEEKFYLSSRGLDEAAIDALLVRARLNWIVERMKDEKAREQILAFIGEMYAE